MPPSVRAGQSGATPASDAWRAIAQRVILRDAIVLRGLCNLAWPAFTIAVPFAVAHRYHLGIGGYGLILAGFGLGNLLGNIASAHIAVHLARWCAFAWKLTGLGFIALAAAPTYMLFLMTASAIGVCTPVANVSIDVHIATTVPHHLLARVYTAQRLLVVAASAIGLPAAATLVSHGGPSLALQAAGIGIAAVAVTALIRQLR